MFGTLGASSGGGLGYTPDLQAFDRYRNKLDAWAASGVTDKPITYEDLMAGTYYATDKVVTPDFLAFLAATSGTFTRASGGTMHNSAGGLVEFAPNIPRVTDRGLLVEPVAATNLIRNPRCEGAVVGSPGTLPTYWEWGGAALEGVAFSIVGSGADNGYPYVDLHIEGVATNAANWRLSTELSGANAPMTGSAVALTSSAYIKLVAGSLNGFTIIRHHQYNYDASNAMLTTMTGGNLVGSITGDLKRYDFTATTPATTARTNPRIQLYWNNGAVINCTLRIAVPQLVLASRPTSVVLPPVGSPAQATRLAEALKIDRTNPSVISKLLVAEVPPIGSSMVLNELNNGGSTERIYVILLSDGSLRFRVRSGDIQRADLNLGSPTPGSIIKVAYRAAANNFAASLNGGAVITDTDGLMPTTINTERLGYDYAGSNFWGAPILENHEFPALLSNPKLQALSALV